MNIVAIVASGNLDDEGKGDENIGTAGNIWGQWIDVMIATLWKLPSLTIQWQHNSGSVSSGSGGTVSTVAVPGRGWEMLVERGKITSFSSYSLYFIAVWLIQIVTCNLISYIIFCCVCSFVRSSFCPPLVPMVFFHVSPINLKLNPPVMLVLTTSG